MLGEREKLLYPIFRRDTMRKKGFTLIELLGVIVILSIIALISVPFVLNILSNAKEAANKRTIDGIIHTADLYYAESLIDPKLANKFDGFTNVFEEIQERLNPKLNGKGNVYITEQGNIGVSIVLDGKCYTKDFEDSNVVTSSDFENCFLTNEIASSYVGFGGNYLDSFQKVISTKDGGYLAIGHTNSSKIGNLKGHGNSINYDGLIVKFDPNGRFEWYQNYGGEGHDYFYSVLEEENRYLVVSVVDKSNHGNRVFQCVLIEYSLSGEKLKEKILFETYDIRDTTLLKKEDHYYLVTSARALDLALGGACIPYIIEYNSNFQQVSITGYTDSYESVAVTAIINSSGNIIFVGDALGSGGIFESIEKLGNGMLVEVDFKTKEVLSVTTADVHQFRDIQEVDDGYIVVGYKEDAIISKYGKEKNAKNSLPLIWNNIFKGESVDVFHFVVSADDSILVAGYSRSNDQDMEDLNPLSIQAGIVVKYDLNGKILKKRKIGGSKGEVINDLLVIENGFILVGESFSTDGDMLAYQYGNKDAILMKIDSELNPVADLTSKILLMDPIKELVKNYGDHIPLIEEANSLKLYTTNDPTTDLGKWCTSEPTLDPESNYPFVTCLKPFNESDIITHSYATFKENHHEIAMEDLDHWISFEFYYGDAGYMQISSIQLKFEGSDYITIEEAVRLKYIEPLVLTGNNFHDNLYFPNSYQLLSGGSTGMGKFPVLDIKIKPKVRLTDMMFASSYDLALRDGCSFSISEYRNFDISLTKID